jgi:hypothetical protein
MVSDNPLPVSPVSVSTGPASPTDPEKSLALPVPAAARAVPRYSWWLVLCLVGLDYFSTLAYLPTVAVDVAGDQAPLAALGVVVVTLLLALPVYLFVVGRSPHGQGATGLLESHVHGWGGKILILILLGFVTTDFIVMRTLSVADASKHLIHNPYWAERVDSLLENKESIREALPPRLRGEFFDWWDEQLVVAVLLTVIGFGLYFFVVRGFTPTFMYTAAAIVVLFLLLNAIVIGSSLLYLSQHPDYMKNWLDLATFGLHGQGMAILVWTLVRIGIIHFPLMAIGLSGFELSMASAELVKGRPDDDPIRPRGRIRNARKLLVTAAVVMSLFIATSILAVTLLVPQGLLQPGGAARDRALAYIAHGGLLKPAGAPVHSLKPPEDVEEGDEMPAPPLQPAQPRAPEDVPAKFNVTPVAGSEVSSLFGPVFGTVYDISTILILCLAGASLAIGLRDVLPHYLTRYGMEMQWSHRVGLSLNLFNLAILIILLWFHASVTEQLGAYATCVLVLLASAAIAAIVDLNSRWGKSVLLPVLVIPLALVAVFFLIMVYPIVENGLPGWMREGMAWVFHFVGFQGGANAAPGEENSVAGLTLPLLFVVVILATAAFSRWKRSTELRFEGFTFTDEASKARWEEIQHLEFQVLVPHRPDHLPLAEKERQIRADHRLAADVPIIFIEAELGDPSNFYHMPLMQIIKEDGFEVIRVSRCASIAHVLAAIGLEFSHVGRPPEIHFAWSEESPVTANLHFLLWGEGNIPWMVNSLLRHFEPDATRRPRVVIG